MPQPHAKLVCGLHLLFFKQVKVSHNPWSPNKKSTYSISWFCQCSVASQEHWQNLLYQISTNLPHHSTTCDTGLWIASPILQTGQSQSQPLIAQQKKVPTRSHDFANALWHHRNIDKTFYIKSLQICHITQPCNTDLWIASPILQTGQSQSQPLIAQQKKFPTRSHDFPNALWHHRNIDKILDIKSLQICHITQPCNTDLWIASPILQTGQSQSQPLIAH